METAREVATLSTLEDLAEHFALGTASLVEAQLTRPVESLPRALSGAESSARYIDRLTLLGSHSPREVIRQVGGNSDTL